MKYLYVNTNTKEVAYTSDQGSRDGKYKKDRHAGQRLKAEGFVKIFGIVWGQFDDIHLFSDYTVKDI